MCNNIAEPIEESFYQFYQFHQFEQLKEHEPRNIYSLDTRILLNAFFHIFVINTFTEEYMEMYLNIPPTRILGVLVTRSEANMRIVMKSLDMTNTIDDATNDFPYTTLNQPVILGILGMKKAMVALLMKKTLLLIVLKFQCCC